MRAKAALEPVHTDTAGPTDPESRDGFRLVLRVLESFKMPNCKPRATPCEQKVNYTDDAEKMIENTENIQKIQRGSWQP